VKNLNRTSVVRNRTALFSAMVLAALSAGIFWNLSSEKSASEGAFAGQGNALRGSLGEEKQKKYGSGSGRAGKH